MSNCFTQIHLKEADEQLLSLDTFKLNQQNNDGILWNHLNKTEPKNKTIWIRQKLKKH